MVATNSVIPAQAGIQYKNEIKDIFDEIKKSYADCLIGLSLAQPVCLPRIGSFDAINNTNIVSACISIPTALLHRALLGVMRITDHWDTNAKNKKNRISFDRLFYLIEQDIQIDITDIKGIYSEYKSLPSFKRAKEIRNGRVAHLLDNTNNVSLIGQKNDLYMDICTLHNEIQKIINLLAERIKEYKIPTKTHEFWNETSRSFWRCISENGERYISK